MLRQQKNRHPKVGGVRKAVGCGAEFYQIGKLHFDLHCLVKLLKAPNTAGTFQFKVRHSNLYGGNDETFS